MRSSPSQIILYNATAANGVTKTSLVSDYEHIVLDIGTSGVGAGEVGTIKVQASSEIDAPDFSLAQSLTNFWDYISFTDLNTGLTVDGSVGLTINGADIFKRLEVQENGTRHVCLEISGVSGTYTLLIKLTGYSNI